MDTDDSKLTKSLTLLIARHVFDGASPERVAELYNIAVGDVNRASYECRERLSEHFATIEGREYQLLNDNTLQARVLEILKLLLEWREVEQHVERLAQSERNMDSPEVANQNPEDESEQPPEQEPRT